MIPTEDVISIHNLLIERFGGIKGIRDKNSLDSALNRPYQTFEGQDLYPSIIEKLAALIESIIKNHPFNDGNKRLGYTLCRLVLLENKMDLDAKEDDKYSFIIQIAENKLNFDEISDWLKKHVIK